MSTIGTKIDDSDTGPIGFQYYGDWGLGEPIPEHNGGTAHYSKAPGSKAVLFFRGTSVSYYADREAHLSRAAILLDNNPAEMVNLTSATTLNNQLVWAKNVSDGDHQLVIQHAGPVNTNIMIDYVTLQSNGGYVSSTSGPAASSVDSSALIIDDTDPRLVFSPNHWRFVTEGMFYNKSSWITQTPGASAQLTFNGTAIWYFSDTNVDHGAVRIRLDDDDEGELATGTSPYPLVQRLIWYKTGLSAGTHTLNITHEDSDGKYATLDFFRYVESAGSTPNEKKLGAGPIIGIVIAALFLLGILYCTLLCVFRTRKPQADPNAPPSYHANASTDSDISEPNRQYVGLAEDAPLGHTIPMGTVVLPPASIRSMSASTASESGPSTPAQRYRDSVRASMVLGESVPDPGTTTIREDEEEESPSPNLSPQVTRTAAPLSEPPPYKHQPI
ncbi:hypothetical protein BDV93DRAFT_608509 [Ceratobasidium sp. AG-I]|nr:hypothetical protein BDV93DRAFT_608509 [Ceratobasidium sp. AG-I]